MGKRKVVTLPEFRKIKDMLNDGKGVMEVVKETGRSKTVVSKVNVCADYKAYKAFETDKYARIKKLHELNESDLNASQVEIKPNTEELLLKEVTELKLAIRGLAQQLGNIAYDTEHIKMNTEKKGWFK